jgi:hypothetical protein
MVGVITLELGKSVECLKRTTRTRVADVAVRSILLQERTIARHGKRRVFQPKPGHTDNWDHPLYGVHLQSQAFGTIALEA